MQNDQSPNQGELISADNCDFYWDVEYQERQVDEVILRPRASFRQAFGDHPLRVGLVEFRIMLFLAKWPYHAFTRRQISDAVSTESHSISEASVDGHIASLRDQLGVFQDFVQSVPHIGYRFKA